MNPRHLAINCVLGALLWAAVLWLAWPAHALLNGDYAEDLGVVRGCCQPGTQAGVFANVCISGVGVCAALDEGYHAAGTAPGDPPLCDSDDVAFPGTGLEGDAFTHRRTDNDARVTYYDVLCDLQVDAGTWNICEALDPIEDDILWASAQCPSGTGQQHNIMNVGCDGTLGWAGLAGRTYKMDLPTALTSIDDTRIDLVLTCGTTVRTWSSLAGGTFPQIALTADTPCTLALSVWAEQATQLPTAMQPIRSSNIRARVLWYDTPQQGGGCGMGAGLLLLLPLLRKLHRRVSRG